MKKLKILIIGNTTSSGTNLKKGLLKHHSKDIDRVDLVFDLHPTVSGVYDNNLLDPNIISVSALECLACGCKLKYHEDKDRNFVLSNASIKVVSNKIFRIYCNIIERKNKND